MHSRHFLSHTRLRDSGVAITSLTVAANYSGFHVAILSQFPLPLKILDLRQTFHLALDSEVTGESLFFHLVLEATIPRRERRRQGF